MKKVFVLFFSALLAVVLPLSTLAENGIKMDGTVIHDDLSQYIHYTIDLTAMKASSAKTTVDAAVDYVKSLQLTNKGYAYIEEACLDELEQYRQQGATVYSYTVLVPKAAKSDVYYGTYNNIPFYVDYSSIANVKIEKDGPYPSSTALAHWVQGLFSVGMAFAHFTYGIPYALVSAALGNPSNVTYSYGSHNSYVFQAAPRTRLFYTYRGSSTTRTVVFQDQRGEVDIRGYFEPVSTDVDNDYVQIFSKNDQTLWTSHYYDTSFILLRAYTMYTHNSCEYWFLSTELLTETWE